MAISPVCGLHDQFVAAARDDQVVAVVRDGRSEGSVLQVESGDVADGRRSVRGVAVQDDHLLVAPFFPGRDQFFTGNQRSLFGTNDP